MSAIWKLLVVWLGLMGSCLWAITDDEYRDLCEVVRKGEASQDQIDLAIGLLSPDGPNERQYWHTLRDLGQYRERAAAALPWLLEQLEHEDGCVRSEAAFALGKFGPMAREAVPKLHPLIDVKRTEVAVLSAVGDIGDERSIPVLLSYLEGDGAHDASASYSLARYPIEVLKKYADAERSLIVHVRAPKDPKRSSRDVFGFSGTVDYWGVLSLDGFGYRVNFPDFVLERKEIVCVITEPSGKVYRLTMHHDPADTRQGIVLSTIDHMSFSAEGGAEHPWVQDDLPDFNGEGIYRIRVEGAFLNKVENVSLPFVSNEISIELRSEFPTVVESRAAHKKQMAEQYPNGFVTVRGQVNTPGPVGVRERLTVAEALEAAGGLTRIASDRNVRLRRKKEGEWQVIRIDLRRIRKGEAEDVELQVGDILEVGEVRC